MPSTARVSPKLFVTLFDDERGGSRSGAERRPVSRQGCAAPVRRTREQAAAGWRARPARPLRLRARGSRPRAPVPRSDARPRPGELPRRRALPAATRSFRGVRRRPHGRAATVGGSGGLGGMTRSAGSGGGGPGATAGFFRGAAFRRLLRARCRRGLLPCGHAGGSLRLRRERRDRRALSARTAEVAIRLDPDRRPAASGREAVTATTYQEAPDGGNAITSLDTNRVMSRIDNGEPALCALHRCHRYHGPGTRECRVGEPTVNHSSPGADFDPSDRDPRSRNGLATRPQPAQAADRTQRRPQHHAAAARQHPRRIRRPRRASPPSSDTAPRPSSRRSPTSTTSTTTVRPDQHLQEPPARPHHDRQGRRALDERRRRVRPAWSSVARSRSSSATSRSSPSTPPR